MDNLKFKVQESTTGRLMRTGIVKDWNTITVAGANINISNKSKSVKGLNTFYIVNNEEVFKEFRPPISKHTKLVLNRLYNGENDNFRPYRPGLEVDGYVSNNEFIITNVKHLEYQAWS